MYAYRPGNCQTNDNSMTNDMVFYGGFGIQLIQDKTLTGAQTVLHDVPPEKS